MADDLPRGLSRPANVCLVGLIAGGHSGVPRYAAKLAQALDRVAEEEPRLSLSVLTNRAGAEAIQARSIDVRVVGGQHRAVNSGPGRLFLEHTSLVRVKADLLHFFDVSGPILAPRRRFVATAHDATLVHYGFGILRTWYKRRLYPWALRRASAVVAVSQFAKDETVQYFGVDPAKIAVVHSGPGLGSAYPGSPTPERERTGPYLLYVGNLGTNKNLSFLVRSFHRADPRARLVLASPNRRGSAEVTAAISGGPAQDRIEIVEGVTDQELDRLYRSALALVLPSTYEGFGFTALEAMGRGCPVLASDIPALREVSGSGAMLLPVSDESAWAAAILRVVEDEELRSDLRKRGAAAVSRYSWERTARGVLDVFSTLLLPLAPD